ncbi:hypothetical protein P885DRAFT_66028 [Corynascus similis CBS 632.67]
MSQPSYSNRSSAEPSSNPTSPSPSPAAASSDPSKRKRTRASKPKVRTGCITCKARTEFVLACEWNETLRSMRRIEADLDGTEAEKRIYARFRAATVAAGSAHLCNFAAFWPRLTPLAGCQDEAVKHAVVALAAAYQLFQHPHEPAIDGLTRDDLEILTIQHYSQSIERLQVHAGSSGPESVRLTLICCLTFISLETLRGNHDVAVSHLINGLRILQSLPDSSFDSFASRSTFVWHHDPTAASLQMPDILRIFARFERSACFFTHGIQPVVSEHGYRTRRFDDGSSEALFPDLAHARMAMSCFQHDVMARLHEITVATLGDSSSAAMFWSDPIQQRQQACLVARSARLGLLTADFFSPSRFGTPDPTSSQLIALYLDLLYFRCAQFLITNTAGSAFDLNAESVFAAAQHFHQHHHHPQGHSTPPAAAILTNGQHTLPPANLLPSILSLASRLFVASMSQPQPQQQPHTRVLTTLHTHLLGPLYLVASHIPDPHDPTRNAAVKLLSQILVRSGSSGVDIWGTTTTTTNIDISYIERVISDEIKGRSTTEPPRALTGVGCLPLLWDALALAGVLT